MKRGRENIEGRRRSADYAERIGVMGVYLEGEVGEKEQGKVDISEDIMGGGEERRLDEGEEEEKRGKG